MEFETVRINKDFVVRYEEDDTIKMVECDTEDEAVGIAKTHKGYVYNTFDFNGVKSVGDRIWPPQERIMSYSALEALNDLIITGMPASFEALCRKYSEVGKASNKATRLTEAKMSDVFGIE